MEGTLFGSRTACRAGAFLPERVFWERAPWREGCCPAARRQTPPGTQAAATRTDGVRDARAAGERRAASAWSWTPATTEDADIVVVGSGIGGFMASMIAKEQAPDAAVDHAGEELGPGRFHELRGVQRPRIQHARGRGAPQGHGVGEQDGLHRQFHAAHRAPARSGRQCRLAVRPARGRLLQPRRPRLLRRRQRIVLHRHAHAHRPRGRRGHPHEIARNGTADRRRVHRDGHSVHRPRRQRRARQRQGGHSGHRRHVHQQGAAGAVFQPGHEQDHRLGRRSGRRRTSDGRANRAWPGEPPVRRKPVQQHRQRGGVVRLRFSAGRMHGHAVLRLLRERIRPALLRRVGRRAAGHQRKRQTGGKPGVRVLHRR